MTKAWEVLIAEKIEQKFGDIENHTQDDGKTYPFRYTETGHTESKPACGFFTVALSAGNERLGISLTTTDAADHPREVIHLSSSLREHAMECKKAVEDYLKAKGFIGRKEPLNEEDIRRIIIKKMQDVMEVQLGTTPIAPSYPKGIFNARIRYPHAQCNSITLIFDLKPSHYVKAGETYRPKSDSKSIVINTNTDSPERAKQFYDIAVQTLEQQFGAVEANLGNVTRPNRGNIIIDPDWINPEKIRVLDLSHHHSSYQIMLIPSGDSSLSKPVIFASGTLDRTRAEAMCERVREYVQSFKSGGANAGEELTLKTIRNHVHKELPPDEIERKPKTVPFRHNVTGGGAVKLLVKTPHMEANKDEDGKLHHKVFLYFTPPRTQGFGRPDISMLTYDVNTQSPELAALRMQTIKHLAVAVLDSYFKENPDVSIVTETRHSIQNGKPVKVEAFTKQVLKPVTDDHHIMFESLRESIKARLEDYTRYINWDTRIEKAPDGKQVVHFQVKRNDGEAMDGDEYTNGFAVRFETEKEARAFTDILEATIIGAQFSAKNRAQTQPTEELSWTRMHISRERPVPHFSSQSMAMVVRESLRSALEGRKVDMMGSNVLATLTSSPDGQKRM